MPSRPGFTPGGHQELWENNKRNIPVGQHIISPALLGALENSFKQGIDKAGNVVVFRLYIRLHT